VHQLFNPKFALRPQDGALVVLYNAKFCLKMANQKAALWSSISVKDAIFSTSFSSKYSLPSADTVSHLKENQ
jgi:hypothetical protein